MPLTRGKAVLLVSLFAIALAASAQAECRPRSSVRGLDDVCNSHQTIAAGAGSEGAIYRGSAPDSKKLVDQLIDYGITDVLIFKQEDGPVKKERAAIGSRARVKLVEFPWKELPPYAKACGKVMDALEFLVSASRRPGAKAFFHCTKGEDRTGFLAGILRLLMKERDPRAEWADPKRVFQDEMCGHGYADGSDGKPKRVVEPIHQELTPLYLKFAYWISKGELTEHRLNRAICEQDPTERDDFRREFSASRFRCRSGGGRPD